MEDRIKDKVCSNLPVMVLLNAVANMVGDDAATVNALRAELGKGLLKVSTPEVQQALLEAESLLDTYLELSLANRS